MRRQQQKLISSSATDNHAAARPMVGAISVSARQRAISIRPILCSPEINRRRLVDFLGIFDGHVGRNPDRREERARIEACGGLVVSADGARVEGILAMSRAIGDKYLKPNVTPEPEITFTKREAEDECLILASDGLWDVISSDIACEVARECLREEDPADSSTSCDGGGAIFSSRSMAAAALLTRLALGRNSYDNISVIVVDLKRDHAGI